MSNLKSRAHRFLREVERSIERMLPPPDVLRAEVRALVGSAKLDNGDPHMRWPEGAFLSKYVLPPLHSALRTVCGLSPADATKALLSESYRHMQAICSGTPARSARHPFDKSLAPSARQIVQKWRTVKPLTQSCPDLALRAPCDYTIVFEGKYFEQGSAQRAEADLVTNLYQAFFYRALPKIAGTATRPAWDYDFSCLLACDASPQGTLRKAWNSLDQSAREGFWDGASVYVMILRNDG